MIRFKTYFFALAFLLLSHYDISLVTSSLMHTSMSICSQDLRLFGFRITWHTKRNAKL